MVTAQGQILVIRQFNFIHVHAWSIQLRVKAL